MSVQVVRPLYALAAFTVVSLAVGMQTMATSSTKPRPQSTSGNSTGVLFTAANAGSGTAIESILGSYNLLAAPGNSLVGAYNGSGSGNGVLGYSSGGYGGVFESFGGTLATLYSQNYTAVGGPGVQGVSGGNGVLGQSSHSNGVVGTTAFASGNSGSFSGVLGEDLTNSTGSGGTFGNAGVTGTSLNGFGMIANSTNNTGLYVNSGGGDALQVNATGANNNAIYVADSQSFGYGLLSVVSGGGNAKAVVANDTSAASVGSSSYGLYATSIAGTALYAQSAGANTSFTSSVPTFHLVGTGADTLLMLATDASTSTPVNALALFSDGNLYIHGVLASNQNLAIVHRSDGRVSTAYTPHMATRTIEDVGEGHLINGSAEVALDRDVVASMDRAARYMVFITPEGNSSGLYVASKTAIGFTVRENNMGRATMAFSYRVVAKPFAEPSERMHAMTSDENRELATFMAPGNYDRVGLDARHLRQMHVPTSVGREGFIPQRRVQPILRVR